MKNSAIGSNWKDIRSELFTKEEILESDMRVAIMSELIEARQDKPPVGHGPKSPSQFRKDTSSRPPRTEKELIGRTWKTLTNLTVIVPQVYNIEKSTYSLF